MEWEDIAELEWRFHGPWEKMGLLRKEEAQGALGWGIECRGFSFDHAYAPCYNIVMNIYAYKHTHNFSI